MLYGAYSKSNYTLILAILGQVNQYISFSSPHTWLLPVRIGFHWSAVFMMSQLWNLLLSFAGWYFGYLWANNEIMYNYYPLSSFLKQAGRESNILVCTAIYRGIEYVTAGMIVAFHPKTIDILERCSLVLLLLQLPLLCNRRMLPVLARAVSTEERFAVESIRTHQLTHSLSLSPSLSI